MGGLFLIFPQVERKTLQIIALSNSTFQIVHRADEANPGAAGKPHVHHQIAQSIQQKLTLLVIAVGGQRKLHKAESLVQQIVQFRFRLHDGGQFFHVGAFAFGELPSFQRQCVELFNILLKLRVVKALIKEG